MDEQRVGEWVRGRRTELLLTQEELASRAGIGVRTIQNLESGAACAPRPGTLRQLVDVLGPMPVTDPRDAAGKAAGPPLPPPPAGVPAPGRPAQLPGDVSAFTGRWQELAALDTLLADPAGGEATAVAIGVICGSGGVGKTALAVHWAHRVRERFPDGQLFAYLAGSGTALEAVPAAAVLARFLRALGVPGAQVPNDPAEAVSLYRTVLAGRRVLVVLDDVADAEQVRPLLPGSPGCLVLVTSRDRLTGLVARDGAHRFGLDVLRPDEARTLLGRVLGEDRVGREPAAAHALARSCAYLPLALRVAAADLISHPGKSIADHVDDLDGEERLEVLEVGGDGQASVRAAFEVSYTALPADARALFRRLGLVPGPDVSAALAAALAGMPPRQVRGVLERLAAAHLIAESAPGRYAFHDLLRLFAAERVTAEEGAHGRNEARDRMMDWYLRHVTAAARKLFPQVTLLLAPAAGPEPEFADTAAGYAWLDAERDGLAALVRYAARHGPRRVAWLVADALRRYYWTRVPAPEWQAVAEAGLAAAEADGDLRAQAAAHLSLGDRRLVRGSTAMAIPYYQRAYELAHQTHWILGQAAAAGNLGAAYLRCGNLRAAATLYDQALALERRAGRPVGQALGHNAVGEVLMRTGRLRPALGHFTTALAHSLEADFRTGQGQALVNLGEVYALLGQWPAAIDHLHRAMAVFRALDSPLTQPDALRTLAEVHRDQGRLADALRLVRQAMTAAEQVGDARDQALARLVLASIHQANGDHQDALDLCERVLDTARRLEWVTIQLQAEIGLAAAQLRLDRAHQSAERAGSARKRAHDTGHLLLAGNAAIVQAGALVATGALDAAARAAALARDIHRETGHRLGEAYALLSLAEAQERLGEADLARLHAKEARAVLSGLGIRADGPSRQFP